MKILTAAVLVSTLPHMASAQVQNHQEPQFNVTVEQSVLPGDSTKRLEDLKEFGIEPDTSNQMQEEKIVQSETANHVDDNQEKFSYVLRLQMDLK